MAADPELDEAVLEFVRKDDALDLGRESAVNEFLIMHIAGLVNIALERFETSVNEVNIAYKVLQGMEWGQIYSNKMWLDAMSSYIHQDSMLSTTSMTVYARLTEVVAEASDCLLFNVLPRRDMFIKRIVRRISCPAMADLIRFLCDPKEEHHCTACCVALLEESDAAQALFNFLGDDPEENAVVVDILTMVMTGLSYDSPLLGPFEQIPALEEMWASAATGECAPYTAGVYRLFYIVWKLCAAQEKEDQLKTNLEDFLLDRLSGLCDYIKGSDVMTMDSRNAVVLVSLIGRATPVVGLCIVQLCIWLFERVMTQPRNTAMYLSFLDIFDLVCTNADAAAGVLDDGNVRAVIMRVLGAPDTQQTCHWTVFWRTACMIRDLNRDNDNKDAAWMQFVRGQLVQMSASLACEFDDSGRPVVAKPLVDEPDVVIDEEFPAGRAGGMSRSHSV